MKDLALRTVQTLLHDMDACSSELLHWIAEHDQGATLPQSSWAPRIRDLMDTLQSLICEASDAVKVGRERP